ncbi:MAG: argininosuccinate lyase, partial [Gaiellaceae bacterium]
MTVWSGRVEGELASAVWDFLRADDAELLPYDCEATRVHARRLAEAGLLSPEELAELDETLAQVADQGAEVLDDSDEDVHSALERLLGEVGRKIHAGRSRNDQVAAALRLYVASACGEAVTGITKLARAVLDLAEAEAQTLMPGYTHLQRAQPVTVGHHLLAWVEMLDRDRTRFTAASKATLESPLGAGALAGSVLGLPSPPHAVRNSLDAVADRDFALDYLYAVAACFSHLSRIGEELCLWASTEFGFVRLPESAATGSSMMPQKLNPDVAELVRGKAGTAIGRLAGLLATVKGLPLSYNRDLQEDKGAVFGARRDLGGALAALSVLVTGLEVDRARLAEAASDPLLRATDAAERLVLAGTSFRDAHERVAASVREGSFEPAADNQPRAAPGPGGV